MRTLPVLLALVAACDVALPQAPEADPTLVDRTMRGRISRLEALGAEVVDRLEAAEATLATQEATIAAQKAEIARLEAAVEEAAQRVAAVQGFVDDWQGETVFLSAEVGLLRSRSDQLEARLFGGPGRQGGHLTVLTDYAMQLAGHPPGTPTPADPADVAKLLLTPDPKTGLGVANVDGAGLLLLARLRKRPELLYQAWDQELDSYLTEVMNNPLYKDRPLQRSLAALRDADARLAAAEARRDGEVGEVAALIERAYGVQPAFGFSSPVAGAFDRLLGVIQLEEERRETGDARSWAGVNAAGNAVCLGQVNEELTPPQWVCEDPAIE